MQSLLSETLESALRCKDFLKKKISEAFVEWKGRSPGQRVNIVCGGCCLQGSLHPAAKVIPAGGRGALWSGNCDWTGDRET